MTKEELKPIDVSKYTVTESGNVIKDTKDKLKQEAEEYVKQNYCEMCIMADDCKGGCIDCFTVQAYFNIAEPREKRIAELEQEKQDLEWQLQEVAKDNEDYQKENAELKEKNEELGDRLCNVANNLLDSWCKGDDPCPHLKKRDDQLTKATEIIKKLYAVYYAPCVTESDLKYRDELFAEIKQFLSEVEK